MILFNIQEFIQSHPSLIPIGAILIIWSLVWKALALWKAARLNDKLWFVALFIINTFGILEILYIFGFSKRKSLKI